jgi:phage-related tail fiber protein
MKNFKKMLFLFAVATSLIFACKKDKKVTDTVYNYSVTLNGASEVPANTSTATGTFVGSYRKSTKVLTFTLTYAGITPVAWHIHKGAVGVSAPPAIPLPAIVPSPLVSSITLTAEQETDLLNGDYYVNIHSATFQAGEIRGQIASPVVEVQYDTKTGY